MSTVKRGSPREGARSTPKRGSPRGVGSEARAEQRLAAGGRRQGRRLPRPVNRYCPDSLDRLDLVDNQAPGLPRGVRGDVGFLGAGPTLPVGLVERDVVERFG